MAKEIIDRNSYIENKFTIGTNTNIEKIKVGNNKDVPLVFLKDNNGTSNLIYTAPCKITFQGDNVDNNYNLSIKPSIQSYIDLYSNGNSKTIKNSTPIELNSSINIISPNSSENDSLIVGYGSTINFTDGITNNNFDTYEYGISENIIENIKKDHLITIISKKLTRDISITIDKNSVSYYKVNGETYREDATFTLYGNSASLKVTVQFKSSYYYYKNNYYNSSYTFTFTGYEDDGSGGTITKDTYHLKATHYRTGVTQHTQTILDNKAFTFPVQVSGTLTDTETHMVSVPGGSESYTWGTYYHDDVSVKSSYNVSASAVAFDNQMGTLASVSTIPLYSVSLIADVSNLGNLYNINGVNVNVNKINVQNTSPLANPQVKYTINSVTIYVTVTRTYTTGGNYYEYK